ncbi:MAG TPA: carboxypeptidase-like regulatory domain-containing protein, partial [Daejeonella sp.]|nr:carboxypeptidase-like regulatory domain-containing protein [Daejeonella sp.]
MKKRELYNKVLLPDFTTKKLLLMLNWTITLTFLLVLEVSANSYSQNVKVNLDFQNVKFKRAFSILEQKGNIRLLYSEENLPSDKSITLSVKDTPVMDVLGMILKDTELNFRVLDNGLVVISPQNNEVKDIVVTGVVRDVSGETLPGVSIKLKGTTIGATTDMNGKYTINVPDNVSVLVFTYIGFNTQEVSINGRSTVNVTLQAANTALNEVVVTALGMSKEKKSLGFSVTEVKGSELAATQQLNPVNTLMGKVAGVQIDQSASEPFGNSRIVIRGNSTLSQNNQPIFVIDGVIVDNESVAG